MSRKSGKMDIQPALILDSKPQSKVFFASCIQGVYFSEFSFFDTQYNNTGDSLNERQDDGSHDRNDD